MGSFDQPDSGCQRKLWSFQQHWRGPVTEIAGADVTVGEYGPWTPFGAVQTAGGYEVAWKTGTGLYTVWSTDSNGNYLTNLIAAVPGTGPALEGFEPTFGQDLNGDEVTGLYAAPGTTLQITIPLASPSGSTTIGAGAQLIVGATDSASVTFASSEGTLALMSPSAFSGMIFGFTGDGTLSGSDQIDLKGTAAVLISGQHSAVSRSSERVGAELLSGASSRASASLRRAADEPVWRSIPLHVQSGCDAR